MNEKNDYSDESDIDSNIKKLSDLITEAHARIQQDFKNIDPIVGVNQQMRKAGIPVDLMTIDCLRTNKRIILLLNDMQPNILSFQFSYKNCDPTDDFETVGFSKVTVQVLYDWMKNYFSQVQ